jgi:hypothetical protein
MQKRDDFFALRNDCKALTILQQRLGIASSSQKETQHTDQPKKGFFGDKPLTF